MSAHFLVDDLEAPLAFFLVWVQISTNPSVEVFMIKLSQYCAEEALLHQNDKRWPFGQ